MPSSQQELKRHLEESEEDEPPQKKLREESRCSNLTNREERRLEINRQRAKESRRRKKRLFEDMQKKIALLTLENTRLKQVNKQQAIEIEMHREMHARKQKSALHNMNPLLSSQGMVAQGMDYPNVLQNNNNMVLPNAASSQNNGMRHILEGFAYNNNHNHNHNQPVKTPFLQAQENSLFESLMNNYPR